MKILHIAVHMGAGAGKAISGLALSDDRNTHKILLLEKPEKTDHLDRCRAKGVNVIISPSREQMVREVLEADVVILNWWHHPLTYKTLMELSDVPSRIVLWSHVNGLYYPRLKPDMVGYFDACMFTSKASLENQDWSEEEKECIHKKSTLVYGMGDFEPGSFREKPEYSLSQEISVGYVGTLDYAKLHPDFVNWLKEVVDFSPKVCFKIAGDPAPELEEDIRKAGLSENVELLGFRTDIPELLCKWDIFIYPLNPLNFATTENALLEAMAAGLPIIASDGIVERSIIEDKETGFLVSDAATFAKRMDTLLQDKNLREKMGQNARCAVVETYNGAANLGRFHEVVNTVMTHPKTKHEIASVIGTEALSWFLSGCGTEETKLLKELSQSRPGEAGWQKAAVKLTGLSRIYKGNAKGSIKQYSRYYPEDKGLSTLTKIMEEA